MILLSYRHIFDGLAYSSPIPDMHSDDNRTVYDCAGNGRVENRQAISLSAPSYYTEAL